MPAKIPPDRPANPDFDELRRLGGPLAAQLAAYTDTLGMRNPVGAKAYKNLVKHLIELDVGSDGPAPGNELPAFVLPGDDGRLWSSDELLRQGPLVISFNRGSWCPFCWLELSALEDVHDAVVKAGASIVSITPEVAHFSKRLKRRLALSYPVLTDLDNSYALELGLAFALTDEVRSVYNAAGIELGALHRSDGWFLPIPATLLVDAQGTIRHAYVNADFRERMEPASLSDLIARL